MQVRNNNTKDADTLEFLEKLRAHIILAGGRKFSDDELLCLSLNALINMIYSNGISLGVKSIEEREDWL